MYPSSVHSKSLPPPLKIAHIGMHACVPCLSGLTLLEYKSFYLLLV